MTFLTLQNIDVKNRRVLVRVDYNVPLDEKGNIADDSRIKASLKTLHYLIEKNAKIILISHLGRPQEIVEKLKMDKVAIRLSELLGRQVKKFDDCIGPDIEDYTHHMKPGEIVLLENLRFHPEEEQNDHEFAQELSKLGDFFVMDAFGTMHRANASTEAVMKHIPSVAGLLVQKELEIMGTALNNPERPFAVVLGGSKVSDKIGVIKNLAEKTDNLLIGGGMMFTFIKAKGFEIGKSLLEEDRLEFTSEMLKNPKIVLPIDVAVADKFDKNADKLVVKIGQIPKEWTGMDIGRETILKYKEVLKNAKTIIWNGPLGVYEFEKFEEGTREIAEFIAGLDAKKIAGGGDTAAAIEKFGLTEKFTHVSTGGGATLEFFEGKKLPAVKALEESYERFKNKINIFKMVILHQLEG